MEIATLLMITMISIGIVIIVLVYPNSLELDERGGSVKMCCSGVVQYGQYLF